jgi:hypothetical protein
VKREPHELLLVWPQVRDKLKEARSSQESARQALLEAEEYEKAHWVNNLGYFVAVAVFVLSDSISRLIALRYSIVSDRVVLGF